MRALEQMVSAAGAPLFLAEFHDLDGHAVAVCLWRHGDVRFEVRSSDVLRVGMNLGGAFKGFHVGAGQVVGISGIAGAMGLIAPGTSCETKGEGRIDVAEIHIDVRGRGYPARGWPDLPPLDVADEGVRAALVATFVAARAGDVPRSRRAATALRSRACTYLLSQAQRRDYRKGGLRPPVRRRVERLIETQLDSPQDRAPNVAELAAAAGLSVNHFIRAFRQDAGTTPHQHVAARRRQRAMGLLGEPGLSVADVATLLGFSSPAHFVASFRERLGVTPGAYRDAVLGPGAPASTARG